MATVEARGLANNETIQDASPGTVVAGEVVKLASDYFGVYCDAAATGEQVGVIVKGEIEIELDGADSPTVGVGLYWDDANSRVTTVDSATNYVGRCSEDSTGTRVKLRLNEGAADASA